MARSLEKQLHYCFLSHQPALDSRSKWRQSRSGAETMAFQSASSSATKGESLLDTANTLRAIGVDAFVIRHRQVGAAQFLADNIDVPVINAGDGINEHPTQALLDALTMRDALGVLQGKTVGIVGDVRHSRVARSNCFLLNKLGAHVLMSGPGTLCPNTMSALGVSVRSTMDEVFNEADALMMLRIQRERLGRAMLPSDAEYTALYGLSAERFNQGLVPVVLHPDESRLKSMMALQTENSLRCLDRCKTG